MLAPITGRDKSDNTITPHDKTKSNTTKSMQLN